MEGRKAACLGFGQTQKFGGKYRPVTYILGANNANVSSMMGLLTKLHPRKSTDDVHRPPVRAGVTGQVLGPKIGFGKTL